MSVLGLPKAILGRGELDGKSTVLDFPKAEFFLKHFRKNSPYRRGVAQIF